MLTERQYKIPNFVLEARLGAGASGFVFKAKEVSRIGQMRAIKVLDPMPWGNTATYEERFDREAQTLIQLSHRGIVRYIVSGYTEDEPRCPYIVMELVDGDPLREIASQLSIDEKLDIIIEVLNALSFTHSQNIFHRDIKPSNIVIRASDKQPIIVDFGLAFLPLLDTSLTKSVVGTPGYVPMEVQVDPLRSRGPNHDIYATGVSLYEILAGRLPNIQNYIKLQSIDNRLVGLDSIIQQALANEQSRFRTADEFAGAIQGWIRQESARRQLTPSRHSTSLRERMIAKDTIRQESELREQEQSERIKQLCNEKELLIIEACKNGIRETFAQIADLRPNLSLIDDLPTMQRLRKSTERNMPLTPICLIADKTADRRYVFATVTEDSLPRYGLREGRRVTPFANFPQSQNINFGQYRSVTNRVWVFVSEGTTQAPTQYTEAGIALMTKDNDALDSDFFIDVFAASHSSAAKKLESPLDIKEFSIHAMSLFFKFDLNF